MRLRRRDSDVRIVAERTLQHWRFDAAADGTLWVQPAGPTLAARQLDETLQAILSAMDDDSIRCVVFDLGRVEVIGPQWTVVLALFLDFAERINAECHLTSLRAQPAAVARFYGRNPAVARLTQSDASTELCLRPLRATA